MPSVTDRNDVLVLERILLDKTDGELETSQNSARPIKALCVRDLHHEFQNRVGRTVSDSYVQSILNDWGDESCAEKSLTPKMVTQLAGASLWRYGQSEAKNSKQFYFVVRDFDKSAVQHLIQLLRSTAAGGNATESVEALAALLHEGDRERVKEQIDFTNEKANPFGIELATTLHNRKRVQQAIDEGRSITYTYLVGKGEEKRHKNRVPLCIDMSEGYTYVVEKTQHGFTLIRLDQMREIHFGKAANDLWYWPDNYETLKLEAQDYIRNAVNRMGGKKVHVKACCHRDHMKKYVEDIFGRKDGFKELPMAYEDHQEYEFWALDGGMLPQSLKWLSWFEILEPKSLRDDIIKHIKSNPYGEFEQVK